MNRAELPATVRRLYDAGLSCRTIGERLGIPQQVVRRLLRVAYLERDDGIPWAEQPGRGVEGQSE